MSVKGFLDKYFKPESLKIVPETILEPMVGTIPRVQLLSSPSKPLNLFVDGACSDNGKRGAKAGYGVHVYGQPSLDISRPLLPTEPQTNNRAELRAIQAALDLIEANQIVWDGQYSNYVLWSDSEYSIHCLTKWAKGWRSNNWKKKDGGLIQNLDLIKPVYEKLQRTPRVSFQHVRGHQDSRRNEFPFDGNIRADALATASLR
jgi:ribonuclease HI